MDCTVHRVTKSRKQLSDFHFLVTIYGYLCFLPMWQLMCFHWKQAQGGIAYVQVNILFLPLFPGYSFVHFSWKFTLCTIFRFCFLAWYKMILALYVPWSQLLSTYLFCFLLFRQWIVKKKRFGNPGKWSSHLSFIWFSSVQLLSRVWLFVIPWISAHQVSLSITNSWGLLKLMSIEL